MKYLSFVSFTRYARKQTEIKSMQDLPIVNHPTSIDALLEHNRQGARLPDLLSQVEARAQDHIFNKSYMFGLTVSE